MTRALLALVAVALVACDTCESGPLQVVNLSSQPWAQEPDTNERAVAIAEEAARWWGGSAEDLRGWTLVIQDGLITCGEWNDTMAVMGCHEAAGRVLRVSTVLGDCIEAAAILHEVGHVIIGDGAHVDPRWPELGFGPGACGYPPLPR